MKFIALPESDGDDKLLEIICVDIPPANFVAQLSS